MKAKLFAIFVLCVFSLNSFAIGVAQSTSKIEGVELWHLSSNSEDNAGDLFIYSGVEPSLMEHCNGSRSIYIYGLKSKYICKAEKIEYGDVKVKIFRTGQIVEDYYVVSIRELPVNSWSFNPVPESELNRIYNLVFDSVLSAPGWGLLDKTVTNLNELHTIKAESKKLVIGSNHFYFYPIKRLISEAGDENIVFSVILLERGSFSFIGFIEGCLDKAHDIDGDGIPEIRTDTCAPGEGESTKYWKLNPSPRLVLEYSY